MDMNTPLGKVRGLGSAKSGTGHVWAQRMTAIALIPLAIWFMASIVQMTTADYFTVREWLASPVSAILMLLFISAGLYHLRLGLQVIIEDYIHTSGMKMMLQLLVLYGCIIIAVTAIFSVLKIAL